MLSCLRTKYLRFFHKIATPCGVDKTQNMTKKEEKMSKVNQTCKTRDKGY